MGLWGRKMKKLIKYLSILLTTMMVTTLPLQAIESTVRIMDITHVKGVRENQLVGYGIVVGLPGTST